MKNVIQFILVIVIAGGAGFFLQRYMDSEEPQRHSHLGPTVPKSVNNQVIGQQRPGFELMDIEGEKRNIDEWNGKILLVNFWATWCPPCKREIPAFIDLQEKYGAQGFQVIGIALDDEQSVRDYADSFGVNYPVLVAEREGIALSQQYGDHLGALPFSVFVDRDGKILLTQTGELTHEHVEKVIQPLLNEETPNTTGN